MGKVSTQTGGHILGFGPLVFQPSVLPPGRIRFGKNNLPCAIIAGAAPPLTMWQHSTVLEYSDSDSKANIVHEHARIQTTLAFLEVTFKHLCLLAPHPSLAS